MEQKEREIDEEQVNSIKNKLKAAAFDNGSVNWHKLFSWYDRDKTGEINFEEFTLAMRKGCKLKRQDVSDDQLQALFEFVDTGGDGSINYEEEFIPWLDPYGDIEGKVAKVFKPKFAPPPNMKKGPVVDNIKRKLRAAAFDCGAVNWGKLFRYYDKDNSGSISFEEFRQAIRRDAKVKAKDVPDHLLEQLFKHIDLDGDNLVQYQAEFLPWLDPTGEDGKKLEKELKRMEKMRNAKYVPTSINMVSPEVQLIKSRLKARAFDDGGVNWKKLFRYYDRNNDGEMNLEEFRLAIRKDAKVSPDVFSDKNLQGLFSKIDIDKDGVMQFENEFLAWLDPLKASDVAKDKADKQAKEEAAAQESRGSTGQGHGSLGAVGGPDGAWATNDEIFKSSPGAVVNIKTEGDFGHHIDADMVSKIKRKMRLHAFHDGYVDYEKLFRYYDRDNSGYMSFQQFRIAIRKDNKIHIDELSDKDLHALFKQIDKDGDHAIEYKTEFLPWLEDYDAEDFCRITKKKLHMPKEPDFAKHKVRRLQEIGLLAQANESFQRSHAMLPFVLRWINYIIDDVGRLTLNNFTQELRDGLILCEIVNMLIPHEDLGCLNLRPHAQPMCIANLEKALWAACRNGLNRANMCDAIKFYEGRRMQMARALCEMFDAMQMRPVRRRIKKDLHQINAVLSSLGRPLLDKTLEDPVMNGHYLLTDFADCTNIMALLVVTDRVAAREMAELYGNPENPEEFFHNASVLNKTLASLALPTLLGEKEWVDPPYHNFDLLILQIHEVWRHLQEEDQISAFDMTAFKFKDRVPLSMSAQVQGSKKQIADEKTRKAHEDDPEMKPLFKAARVFGENVLQLKMYDKDPWEYFDISGDGQISMTEFCDGARRIGFKGNVKKVFGLIDCDHSGQIDREEFHAFCEAVAQPPDADDNAKEEEFNDQFFKMEKSQSEQNRRKTGKPGKKERKYRRRETMDVTLLSQPVMEFVRLIKSYESLDAAFEAFDTMGGGTISMTEFDDKIKSLGMQSCGKKLFKELDLNSSGVIDRKEFKALVVDTIRTHEHWLRQGPKIELLLDNPFTYNREWPSPSIYDISESRMLSGFGDVRFASAAAERSAMMLEECRRNHELREEKDNIGFDISTEAKTFLHQIVETDETAQMNSIVFPPERCFFDGTLHNFSESVAPTTSLSAMVTCTDSSEQPVWLQTAAVDLLGQGSSDSRCTALVLEVRRRYRSASRLVAQLDAREINSIEQLQSARTGINPSGDSHVSFKLSVSSEANLGGSQLEAPLDEEKPIFHLGNDGYTLVLHFRAGPSAWRRREAVNFFDELRLMVHFIRAA